MSKGSHWHRAGRVKVCISCHAELPLSEFYAFGYRTRQGKQSTRYESRCKSCCRKRRRERYVEKSDEEKQSHRDWYARNAEQQRTYRAKRQQDPDHRRNKAKAQRLRKARLRSGSENIGDKKIAAIYARAMEIEAIIQDCPVFELPELGKKIHVDHVTPLSKGGAHDASNLQLLPEGLNLRKGASCLR